MAVTPMIHLEWGDTGHAPLPGEDPTRYRPKKQIDFRLVAQIVRLAGLDCRIDRYPPATLRARPAGNRSGSWTVAAGIRQSTDGTSLSFVGPARASRPRLLRPADERQLAALVVLQALRDNPNEPISREEAATCGLSDGLIWD